MHLSLATTFCDFCDFCDFCVTITCSASKICEICEICVTKNFCDFCDFCVTIIIWVRLFDLDVALHVVADLGEIALHARSILGIDDFQKLLQLRADL